MKTYKLWIEIEEHDSDTDEYRNLTVEGRTEPVPVAVFPTLDEAVDCAESFAMDRGGRSRPWRHRLFSLN